jgi:hypothetical protein
MRISAADLLKALSRAGACAALAAALAAGVSAQSVRVRPDGREGAAYRGSMRVNDVHRLGTVNGYAEGFEHGLEDGREQAAFDFRSDDVYRHALSGYDQVWGYEREYQNAFRNGYEQGYGDGYNGRTFDRGFDRAQVFRDFSYDPVYAYPSYRTGGSLVVGGPAYRSERYDWSDDRPESDELAARAERQGFADGFARGQYDRSIGIRKPNPQGHGAFAKALNGWDPKWGGAGTFQQSYRSSFLEGYWSGYGRK